MQSLLEVCSYSVDSALIAENAGADRIELCAGFPEGGTTPSYGCIALAKQKLSIPVFVMIRPRGGDFLYSDFEFESMKIDAQMAVNLGADGLVFGILKSDGTLDAMRCTEILNIAGNLPCTLHRAFDMSNNLIDTMQKAIDCGFSRILSSGGMPTALDGANKLRELVSIARDSITVMPGCGITSGNALTIKQTTLAHEFHMTGKIMASSAMTFRNELATMAKDSNEFEIPTCSYNEITWVKAFIMQ